MTVVPSDSSVRSDARAVYRVQVPVNFDKRKSTIYNGAQPTSFGLSVREYQRPHALDFVSVNYGETARPITKLAGPVLYHHTIRLLQFIICGCCGSLSRKLAILPAVMTAQLVVVSIRARQMTARSITPR